MASNKANLLLLFERPTEPVFIAKGDSKTVFDVPANFLVQKYQLLGPQLADRFGEESDNKVEVSNITVPDLSIPLQLKRRENFSVFVPKHMDLAAKMVEIFMNCKNVNDLMSTAVYARDRINPFMFNYALSVALLHRTDTSDLAIPNLVESFPAKFVDGSVFPYAREDSVVVPEGSRNPIIIPRDFSATDLDPEHRVAYFREDIGINLHHWHWHLVYPFNASDRSIVAKDRRGELFYYMHQQVLARYNFERLCNNLPQTTRFNNFREAIPEGYFPKLDSLVTNRAWPSRFANIALLDVNRPSEGLRVDITDLERWRDRLREAIEQGFVTTSDGQRINLTERDGIDILGNMIESSILSVNRDYYGDYHNMGHIMIALCHDPDGRYLESFGVMGDSATAMRDPIFYRWHANIDEIFQSHKSRMPSYPVERLRFPNISLTRVNIEVPGGRRNILQTFWQQSDLDLARGLDFSPRGSIFVRFTHLQHRPFQYEITVNNSSSTQQIGTVRIFMGPRVNERGFQSSFNEQRTQMIEMDKFRVNLSPGINRIIRTSGESSVTIPYDRTFRNLNAGRPEGGDDLARFNFCGCGWPDHMLIPKGTPQGLVVDLFVMISNFANDRVVQDASGVCTDAASYCGLLNMRYPDRESMGFPMDRVGRQGVTTLANFLTPNMAVQQVTIQFTDRTEVRGQNTNNATSL